MWDFEPWGHEKHLPLVLLPDNPQVCVYCASIDDIERGPLPGPYKDDMPHYACSACLAARGAVSAWATT